MDLEIERKLDDGLAGAPELGVMPPELEPAFLESVGANLHHRVDYGAPRPGSNVAADIPATGEVSELFAEVDIAMRQFMHMHCAGGATLAISHNDRRVYKRGFGRTRGWAGDSTYSSRCPADAYDPAGRYMLPDTPLGLGSVSKWVVAAIARDLVERRIQQKQMRAIYPDPTAARVFDRRLGLLPIELIRYFDHEAHPEDAICPPVAFDPTHNVCARAATGCRDGEHPTSPDPRWQELTVGDLLGHTGGLPFEKPSWEHAVMPNVGALRGLGKQADWLAEHQQLAGKDKFPSELAGARAQLAKQLKVPQSRVVFLDYYNSRDGEHSFDETLKMVASMCLRWAPAGASDSSPAPYHKYAYSNLGYDILGRIVAHLNADLDGGHERLGAPTGYPEDEPEAALAGFLAHHGLERGVSSEHALFHRQNQYAPGFQDPMPELMRGWTGSAFTLEVRNPARPYCVWSEDSKTCSLELWSQDVDGFRHDWDFDLGTIPFHRARPGHTAGAGGLGGEAPALLVLLERYFASNNSVYQGRERSTLDSCAAPSQCRATGFKSGGMDGTRAWVVQLVGAQDNVGNLPSLDANGRFTMEPNPANWQPQRWDDPADTDFVVLVNADESQASPDFTWVRDFVRWGLQPGYVDWTKVERMIHQQQRHVVGMAVDAHGNTHYWYESDGEPATDSEITRRWRGTPAEHFGDATPDAIAAYDLPASRIGTDVVAVAIEPRQNAVDPVYAWYADGHYSVGSLTDLSLFSASTEYTLPWVRAGELWMPLTYAQIVGVAFAASGEVYSWYDDGTRARGTASDLDADWVSRYRVASAQTHAEIEAITIDWAHDEHVWVRYRDGSVSEGHSGELDAYGYWPALPVSMTIAHGQTTMYYASGWQRTFAGNPLASRVGSKQLTSGDWHVGGDWDHGYREPHECAGIGANDDFAHIWYTDGSGAHLVDGDPVASVFVSHPVGTSGAAVLDTARAADGKVYSWYANGWRGIGTVTDPDAYGWASFEPAAGQRVVDIAAIAIGPSDHVWTVYADGTISEGSSTDLDAHAVHP